MPAFFVTVDKALFQPKYTTTSLSNCCCDPHQKSYGLNNHVMSNKMYILNREITINDLFYKSSPEQHLWKAIVLPSASAAVLASACTNVKVFVTVFKTSLFPNLITDFVHLLYDYTYWSKILGSTIPTTLDHVKVKVTDLEFLC